MIMLAIQIVLISCYVLTLSLLAGFMNDMYCDQLKLILKKYLRNLDQGDENAEKIRFICLDVIESINNVGFQSGLHFGGVPITVSSTTVIFVIIFYSISALATTYDPTQD